jgi:hypothetical protein
MKRFLLAVLSPVMVVLMLALLLVAGYWFGPLGAGLVIASPLLYLFVQAQWRRATNNRYVDPSLPPIEPDVSMLPPQVPNVRRSVSGVSAGNRVQLHPVGRSLGWLKWLEYLLAVLWVLWFTPVVYNGLFSDYHASRGIGMQRLFAQLGSVGIAGLLAITFLSVQHGYFGLRLRARWLGWLGGCGALVLLLWLRRSG